MQTELPAQGQIVHVRARRYLVERVELTPTQPSTLVHLACLEDDAQGEPLEVLWEHEIDAHVIAGSRWEMVAKRGFDAPKLFSAYLHTLRWQGVTATNPKLFQAPYRAGIQVKAYQLDPLYKALQLPRVNLFIADDVGLGKTIEAGLILREMILRQKVQRVVIAVPPSVIRQWHEEMERRFGLTFVIYDRDFVATRRRERGFGVNPWSTHTRFIISHALLRNEDYVAPLRDWLGEFAGASMLILDEAHHAAPASRAGNYAIDSQFTHAIRDLAARFEHRLFLSATPHNGLSNSFSALLEILDPQRFTRGTRVDPSRLQEVMVRRLKQDLREIDGEFPERKVLPIILNDLPDDAPELHLARLLQQYTALRDARLKGSSASKRRAGHLVLVSLQKRLLSSIEAFARTLGVHSRALFKRDTARRQVLDDAERLIHPPGADDLEADLDEDSVEAADDQRVDAASQASVDEVALTDEERNLLEEMARVADRARDEPDARIRYLIDWLHEHLCPDLGQPGATWTSRRVLIFTEYSDTRRYLLDRLGDVIADSEGGLDRIDTFHGGMGDDRRETIKQAFNADPQRHPLRILIATDAAREGLNLQNHCADLFHFDIPWNPARMEQRNGRIDRKLQRAPVVRCHYFILPQRAEDRVLEVLVGKTATIQRELGSLTPVLERGLARLLDQGIQHDRVTDLLQRIEQVGEESITRQKLLDEELEAARGVIPFCGIRQPSHGNHWIPPCPDWQRERDQNRAAMRS